MSRSRIYPLFSPEQIQARVAELGDQIRNDYEGKDPVIIGLLNGVYVFFADLTRAIDLDLDISFLRVASYGGGTESSGEVRILQDLDKSIKGRHAVLVDDITDTGLTIHKVQRLLLDHDPASLKTVSLLDKPSRRRVEVTPDYVGFTIEDHFVVGYGLDLDGKYRNLPYIGIYNPA
jgi:hypoxanthine phosphoribosyltransferase